MHKKVINMFCIVHRLILSWTRKHNKSCLNIIHNVLLDCMQNCTKNSHIFKHHWILCREQLGSLRVVMDLMSCSRTYLRGQVFAGFLNTRPPLILSSLFWQRELAENLTSSSLLQLWMRADRKLGVQILTDRIRSPLRSSPLRSAGPPARMKETKIPSPSSPPTMLKPNPVEPLCNTTFLGSLPKRKRRREGEGQDRVNRQKIPQEIDICRVFSDNSHLCFDFAWYQNV